MTEIINPLMDSVKSVAQLFGYRIKGPDRDGWSLASVYNERYGTEMGIRNIRVSPDDNDISNWYPAKRTPKYRGEFTRDIDEVREIQQDAFNSFSPAEVIRQVLFENKGNVYIDQPLTTAIYVPRIYAIVIDGKLDEEPIQEELTKIDTGISSGNLAYHFPGYFTDHDGLGYPSEWAELYEFGSLKPRMGMAGTDHQILRGYATDFLKLVKKAYETENGKKPWWAIVRVNNISSLKALMRGLGVCATRLQAAPSGEVSHFSEETNFGVDSTVAPLKWIPKNSHPEVWDPSKPIPSGKDFLIRMNQGDESNLKYWRPHMAMLRKVMAVGQAPIHGEHYVMRKVLDDSVTPYLYFTKDW